MESLVIEGKNYISSKRAAEVMGYTQDYIGQLARGGKISAERVGGVWYVSEEEFSGLSKDRVTKEADSVKDLSKMKVDGITNKNNAQSNSNELLNTSNNKNKITLDGINYISSKRAAKIMGYTQDYIGQLCRGGKIEARQVGRGWYIPESIVLKNIKTESVKTQDLKDSEDIETQKKALEDIIVFKDQVNEIPIGLKELQETNEQTQEKEVSKEVLISPSEEIELPNINNKKHKDDKKDYYYPSFLNAAYSLDDTPLIPTPVRSREPVLHQIITEEVDTSKHSVEIRRVPEQMVTAPGLKQIPVQDTRRVQRITSDILKPKNTLSLRSPMSLVKIASMAVVVLFFASALTFVPSVSIFSSDTGMLKKVSLFNTQEHDVFKAEVATADSKTPLIEVVISTISGLFDKKIEYKAQ